MRHALLAGLLSTALGAGALGAGPAFAQEKPQPLPSGARQPPARPFPAPATDPLAAFRHLEKPPALTGDDAREQLSSGTGFVVAPRRVLTNHHVVKECGALRLRGDGGTEVSARVLVSDEDKDLALIATDSDLGPPLTFRGTPAIRRGEGVVTYGFPLAGMLAAGPTLTTGEVSALAGMANNQQQFQISAPVQPGNSGGPLFDLSGNVVGVVVSKLNAQRVAQRTGDIPQNVNFAVKGEVALDFLHANSVEPGIAVSMAIKGAAEVGDIADPSTLFVRCLR